MTTADDVAFALGVLRTHGCTVGAHDDPDATGRWWVVTPRGRHITRVSEAALVELAHDCADRGLAAQPSLLEETPDANV